MWRNTVPRNFLARAVSLVRQEVHKTGIPQGDSQGLAEFVKGCFHARTNVLKMARLLPPRAQYPTLQRRLPLRNPSTGKRER